MKRPRTPGRQVGPSRRVFVDTGVFFALMVAEDDNHPRARALYRKASTEKWKLVTTNAVVFETFALLLNRSRPGRRNALNFLEMLVDDEYGVERISEDDEKRAVETIKRHADKSYSLCDASSFVVMERLKMSDAMSFDQDFRTYGRIVVHPVE